MENKSENNSGQAQKLSAEIKKTWGKLTEEEIGFQASNPSKFYDAVKTKYSINKDEAEKTVRKLEAECAAASSTSGNKNAHTDTASGVASKAANDSSAASKPSAKAANS